MAQNVRIQFRRGLESDIPLLAEGEAGFATDTGVFYVGNGTQNVQINTKSFVCEGRLSLLTQVPYVSTDITDGQWLYYVPAIGDTITLYKNVRWKNYTFSELSYNISTNCNLANKNYDVFVSDSGGSVILSTLVWTNDTTRAASFFSLDGVLVSSSDYEKRYVGTIRTTSTTGRCEFSKTRRFVYNYYNQVVCNLYSCPGYSDNNAATTYSIGVGNMTVRTPELEIINGNIYGQVGIASLAFCISEGSTGEVHIGIGLDANTNILCGYTCQANNTSNGGTVLPIPLTTGYHKIIMCSGAVTTAGTATADSGRFGISTADVPTTYIDFDMLM